MQEYADVRGIDLWQLMEEVESDPNAIDRIFEESQNRPGQMQRDQ